MACIKISMKGIAVGALCGFQQVVENEFANSVNITIIFPSYDMF